MTPASDELPRGSRASAQATTPATLSISLPASGSTAYVITDVNVSLKNDGTGASTVFTVEITDGTLSDFLGMVGGGAATTIGEFSLSWSGQFEATAGTGVTVECTAALPAGWSGIIEIGFYSI